MVHRSCGQLGDLFLNKEPRGHLQWEQAAKVEASVQVPALCVVDGQSSSKA